MEKAYDTKDLVEKLKEDGLDVAEDAAGVLVKAVFAWLTESAAVSETPLDDLLARLYPIVQEQALAQIDKLDGEVG